MTATSPPCTGGDISGHLDAVHAAYKKWFGERHDLDALDCVLAVAAAERLDGDPVWLLLVGGAGAAKTETIMPLAGPAGAVAVSTINGEAALLSGTSKKDQARKATGGLLKSLGSRGVLVIKDVTSILSMNRDTRALVLAALREIYDGRWSRNVGTDGGQTLTWKGRLVIIGAVTTAWDAAHAVISAMGDRFVLVRLDPGADDRRSASRRAMCNVGSGTTMRHELSEAVAALLEQVDPDQPNRVSDAEVDALLQVADLVTRARTAVERDFKGEPLFAHALEMPTRFAKQLVQVMRGSIALGMTRAKAQAAAMRCARDSLPPLRRRVLLDLVGNDGALTSEVVKRVQLPRTTVDRTLQELHLLDLLKVAEHPYGTGVRWAYSLADESYHATLRILAAMDRARRTPPPPARPAPREEHPATYPGPPGQPARRGQRAYWIRPIQRAAHNQ
jgi:hypothetical protein